MTRDEKMKVVKAAEAYAAKMLQGPGPKGCNLGTWLTLRLRVLDKAGQLRREAS